MEFGAQELGSSIQGLRFRVEVVRFRVECFSQELFAEPPPPPNYEAAGDVDAVTA